jgi:uncharacterized protein (DUF1800 family)
MTGEPLTRRGLATAALAAAAELASAPAARARGSAWAQPGVPAGAGTGGPGGPPLPPSGAVRTPLSGPPAPTPEGPQSPALLRRLVERVGYGYTDHEFALALHLGVQGYVEHHLAPELIDDSACDARLAPLTALGMTAQQLVDAYLPDQMPLPMQQLKHACVLRAVYSKRQLFEKVVEFWTDHFAIRQSKGTVRFLKVVDDRDVIRAHAFGRFRELLAASVHSAAMLRFLDNDTNTPSGPNENYARELLELHTLGVDGGYTEQDVKEAARCLTGWRFVPFGVQPYGIFSFVASDHDDGSKIVLEHIFPAGGGPADGETLITLLADHPSTPRFVGRKLARWLLRYEPSEALVDAIAQRWTATDGDIRELLRVILAPEWLADAQLAQHPKLRRPFHFATGLLRTLGAEIPHPPTFLYPAPVVEELHLLGQRPYEWFDPDGFPDTESAWASGLQPRWSFASRLLAGGIGGVALDSHTLMARLAATGAATPGGAVDLLLTGGAFSDHDRSVLDDYAAAVSLASWPQVSELLALGASSLSYQHY